MLGLTIFGATSDIFLVGASHAAFAAWGLRFAQVKHAGPNIVMRTPSLNI